MTDQVEQESVDLVENESEVSEGKGHNPETAPADALASTDAAAKVVKQAPEPKTKGGKIAYGNGEKCKDKVSQAYAS